jgi:hypothetical protein
MLSLHTICLHSYVRLLMLDILSVRSVDCLKISDDKIVLLDFAHCLNYKIIKLQLSDDEQSPKEQLYTCEFDFYFILILFSSAYFRMCFYSYFFLSTFLGLLTSKVRLIDITM